MRTISRPVLLCGLLCMLVSCGGGAKDYSSNKFIQESSTYHEFTHSENYFVFKKDGTGKLQLDKYTYELTFELSGETSVTLQSNEMKMGSGTFSETTSGKRQFSWNSKTYLAY